MRINNEIRFFLGHKLTKGSWATTRKGDLDLDLDVSDLDRDLDLRLDTLTSWTREWRMIVGDPDRDTSHGVTEIEIGDPGISAIPSTQSI